MKDGRRSGCASASACASSQRGSEPGFPPYCSLDTPFFLSGAASPFGKEGSPSATLRRSYSSSRCSKARSRACRAFSPGWQPSARRRRGWMSCIPCLKKLLDSLRGRTTSFAPSYLKTLPFPMRARNSLFCGIFPRGCRSIAGPASREYPGAGKARFSASFWGFITPSRDGYIWKQSEGPFHAPPLCGDCSAMSHRRPGSFPAVFGKICCWQSPRRMTPPFGRCWIGRNAALSATCPTALKPS